MSDFKDERAFYPTRLQEERDKDRRKVITLSLNLSEQAELIEDMRVLRQGKDSTALKQLWQVGRAVLHDKKMGAVLRAVLGNSRKNERVGISDVEPLLPSLPTNVTQKEGGL